MESGKRPNAEELAARTRRLEPEPLLNVIVGHAVDFIVVGGYAVAAHGFARATKDVDICPEPSDGNLQRLATALAELEAKLIGLDEFEGEFHLEPDLEGLKMGGNWVLMTKHGRLDVMQHIDGLGEDGGGWKQLRPHAVTRQFLGHECLFCSYEDLRKMKMAANRGQDRIDLATLAAQRHEAPRP
jgi:hypothetical protein